MAGSRPCTSLQAADAVGLWRCCKGTPEMEQQEGFDPSASTLATLRSTWLSYGCKFFCELLAPPVRGATRGKFLRITHRRHSAGEFTAARSLLWRPAPGAVRSCVRFDPHGKNKKARNPLGNPGLWRESLEGARLRATSTRVRLILVLLSEPQAGRNRGKGVPLRMHLECRQVAATTKQDAHERPARCGSMVQ